MNKTQDQINKDYDEMLKFVNEEHSNAKLRTIEAGFQVDDAVYQIVRRYRAELSELRELLTMNIERK